jgi:hypothetical protein
MISRILTIYLRKTNFFISVSKFKWYHSENCCFHILSYRYRIVSYHFFVLILQSCPSLVPRAMEKRELEVGFYPYPTRNRGYGHGQTSADRTKLGPSFQLKESYRAPRSFTRNAAIVPMCPIDLYAHWLAQKWLKKTRFSTCLSTNVLMT